MSRFALLRCVTALVLVLGSGLLGPAWAAAGTRPPSAPAPASTVAPHGDVATAFWNWVQTLLGKAGVRPGGGKIVVDAGCANDPNGQCH